MNPEKMKRVNGLITKLSQEFASLIFTRSQEEIDEQKINDTGQLKKSGSLTLTKKGARINYAVKYAKYIEFGTAPHFISQQGRENIRQWVRRKLGVSEGEVDRVAEAILWKIALEGTDPKPFVRNGIDKAWNDFKKKYNGKTIRV